MAASRIASSRRICYRYRYFLYFLIIILILQFFLYTLNIKEAVSEKQEIIHTVVKGSRELSLHAERLDSQVQMTVSYQNDGQSYHKSEDSVHYSCQIESKPALSAISRAKTTQCKQEIADAACEAQRGQLYSKVLPNTCHMKGNHTRGHYYGCYRDDSGVRDLNHHKVFTTENWSETCINYCLQIGYKYAGLQYGSECWCGNKFGIYGRKNALCNSPCTGKQTQTCGGYLANDVYSTGIQEKKSKGPGELHTANGHSVGTKVKIVFVLTLNGRQVRQVRRLLKAIYHADHYYLLHVDVRQEYLYRELLPLEYLLPNLRLVRNRFATIWGGASLLDAHLHLIKEVLQSDWKWDFYVNLSESDYPINEMQHGEWEYTLVSNSLVHLVGSDFRFENRKLETLVDFLTKYKGLVFLKSHGRNAAAFLRKQGLDQTFLQCDDHLWRLGPRHLPDGIQIDGGSDWVGLPREFCQYVTTASDQILTGLKKVFKYTLLPVESFFHTVLHNSKFCDKWMDNNLHMTNWNRKKGCKCQYKHIVDWCGCSPNDLISQDLDRLLTYEQKPTFFARKFEAAVNQDIINSMDVYLFGQEMRDVTALTDYWQNEFHHLDNNTTTDDAYLSFYHSFMHLTSNHLIANTAGLCVISPLKLMEVNQLRRSDRFQGLLVKFEVVTERKQKVVLESHLMSRQFYNVFKPNGPIGRLINLEVGSNFDLKESIFRNYAQLLGPFSELVLRHMWGPGPSVVISVAWIDPAAVVAASHDINITEKGQIESHKPRLQTPLRPGEWICRLMYKWDVVAEVKFLVLPLTIYHGKPISSKEAGLHHNGPNGSYAGQDFSEFEQVLNVQNIKESRTKAALNGLKSGQELQDWTNTLSGHFWSVQGVCALTETPENCVYLKQCKKLSWSSESPDPKSEINKVDPITGLIR